MKTLIFAAWILAVSSLGFMACEERGAKTTDSAQPLSNAELENRIKSRLDADKELRSANLKVDADQDKNVATLFGTVESQSLRSKAIDLAKSVQPEVIIKDQIEITPTEVSRKDAAEQMAKNESAEAKQLRKNVGTV